MFVATPKVFVSSTCFDLAEERSQLERFISSYGYQPVLSEYSDVFFDPDEHTHDACVKEIQHCDIFVLIISGRFGGEAKSGQGESITQSEYREARKLNLPIFTFVKSDVLQAQLYYKQNLKKVDEAFARKITYPGITKQSDAVKIFSFINDVEKSQVNNAIEAYKSFIDVEKHLRKQWAGLLYKLLKDRRDNSNVEHINSVLNKLNGTTSQLQSLVSNIHSKEFGEDATESAIEQSKILTATESFFLELKQLRINYKREYKENFQKVFLKGKGADIDVCIDIDVDLIASEATVVPTDNFLVYIENLKIINFEFVDPDLLYSINGMSFFLTISDFEYEHLSSLYESGVKKSNEKGRRAALNKVFDDLLVF